MSHECRLTETTSAKSSSRINVQQQFGKNSKRSLPWMQIVMEIDNFGVEVAGSGIAMLFDWCNDDGWGKNDKVNAQRTAHSRYERASASPIIYMSTHP